MSASRSPCTRSQIENSTMMAATTRASHSSPISRARRRAPFSILAPERLKESRSNSRVRPLLACAVTRRRFPVGASPTRQTLQPEATGAAMEVTQARGREHPLADRPIGNLARDHGAGGPAEPHAARMGELLPSRHRQQSVSGTRQLRSDAVAPVVAVQAQNQASQGRDLSTLASLRALWARTPEPAWARRAVGEGVKFCPREAMGRAAGVVATSSSNTNRWRLPGAQVNDLSRNLTAFDPCSTLIVVSEM